ncbi:autotransporter outer membrane beta-barrel domain-containing protein [Thalassospira sp. MA62]|nr:autotransporter outer membrane beta-barrel domain-containing protein [Thalassospira sp. MA62]
MTIKSKTHGVLSLVTASLLMAGFATTQANAYTVHWLGSSIVYENINDKTHENIAGDSMGVSWNLDSSPVVPNGGTVEFSVSGGATFADSTYTLEDVAGGAGTGYQGHTTLETSSPAGKSSIVFRINEVLPCEDPYNFSSPNPNCLSALQGLVLSGASYNGQSINFNLPNIPGRDIYFSATVRNASDAVLGSYSILMFENTLDPLPEEATEQQTQTAIKDVVATHIRNITSQSVNLSGLMTGRGFGTSNFSSLFGAIEPVQTALSGSGKDFSLPVALQMNNGRGSFAASLNQVMAWKPSLGISDQDPASKPTTQTSSFDSPFNIWMKGRWEGISDDRGGMDGDSNFGLFMVGADYRYNEDTLLGMLVQYDLYEQTLAGQNSKGKGQGWMVGPYIVTRPAEKLIWDARVAWGQSDNKINPLSMGWENYDGERWQAESTLTGELQYEDWNIFPQLGVNFFQEEQKSFTTNAGTHIGSQKIATGNLSFGPEVSRVWYQTDDYVVTPSFALKGIWDFKSPDIERTDGSYLGTEKLRARTEIGASITFTDGGTLSGKYGYDGIGVSGYQAHSVELVGNMPVDFGFFPDGSRLATSLNQAVERTNNAEFQIGLNIPMN